MKKTLKTALLSAAIISSISVAQTAFAKTEGNYLGLDYLRISAKTKTTKEASSNADTYFNTNVKDSANGFGVQYKYAFNINNFFIAPGAFFEKIGTEAKVNDKVNGWEQSFTINNRYGAKVDFGFDVTNNFATYIPVGYAMYDYELKTRDYTNIASLTTKTSGRKGALLYGIGFSFYPSDKISINLEYNRSKLDVKSGGNTGLIGGAILNAKTNLDIFKLGFSYHF